MTAQLTLTHEHRLRTSPALIIVSLPPDNNDATAVGIYDFLAKSFAKCRVEILYWLSYFSECRSLQVAIRDHATYPQEAMISELSSLVELDFITVEGTASHRRCESYRDTWKWDLTAGAFHFTIMDNAFLTQEQSAAEQLDKLATVPPPAFFWPPRTASPISLPCPAPALPQSGNLLELITKRRTNRTSAKQPLSLQQLSECLFAAFGVVGFVKATSGYLPLSTAPSGGARNPFEAYVICRRCSDLPPGIYHYSATTHELELVNSFDSDAEISSVFGGQLWIDDMSVVVVMVAILDRTMWKYQDANAYRVLLIEAGHRGQNFMLTATKLGLTSCPTAAIAHSEAATLFGLSETLLHTPVYALTLDKALTYADEFLPVDRYIAEQQADLRHLQ